MKTRFPADTELRTAPLSFRPPTAAPIKNPSGCECRGDRENAASRVGEKTEIEKFVFFSNVDIQVLNYNRNVRCWHLADNPTVAANVRF